MAAKLGLGFELVKQAMFKLLMKKGDDGIVLTLPKNEIVDYNAKITMDRLIRNGIDPDSLTSPDQVINVLDNINNQIMKNSKVISADSAEGRAITEKLFGKKGEVVDMTGKKIDTSQGIMGGKSVKELMESGQVQKGTDDIKISDKITEREMFKNSNLNKKDSVTETISYIKTLEPIDAMKEANSVIGRKGKYKNLTPEESKKILQDTEDHIFERDIPDEDFAKGGRAGYQAGNQVMPEVDARMKNTYEQNIKLNQIQRNMQDRVRKGSKTQGLEIGQLTEGMYGKPKTEYNLNNPNLKFNEAQSYGAASNMGLRPEQIKAVAYYNTLKNNFGDQGIGMAGPSMGLAQVGGLAPGTNPFGSEKFFKTPAEQFALYQEGLRQQALQGSPEIYFDADKTYDAGDYVSPKGIYTFRDDEFLRNLYNNNTMVVDGKEYASEQDAIDDMGIERYNQFMAKGGRAGYYTGGMVDVEPNLSDIGHGSDALMARTRLVAPDSQATTSTGLNYLLAEDNDNIRVPFSKGKIAKEVLDKGRRGFMKAAGAGAAGLAALKTGLLGFGEKAAPVAKEVIETVSETAQGVPPYFLNLVSKIKNLGDETLASQDKAIAKKYKDYVMEEDFAGNITIMKKGDDVAGNKTEDVYMSLKVDEVPLKGKKGSTKVEEYEEFTARPDGEGKMKDVEPGVPDEVVQEGTMFEDNMTEFGKIKKADGGRIGFGKGDIVTKGIPALIKAGEGKFTKAQYLIERIKNAIKGNPDDKYVQETFPNLIKELEANPDLAKNENVFKELGGDLPEGQKIVVYGDDTLDFFTESSGPQNIKKIDRFMEKHGLSRDKALEIMKMEPDDQVMELTKRKFLKQKRTDNAQGGLQTMLGE